LFCIEFDLETGILVYSNRNYDNFSGRDRSQALRRFPRPDLVLQKKFKKKFSVKIIDYKDVPIEFYTTPKKSHKSANKYRYDIIKQLTYELAIQQNYIVLENQFFIPYYYQFNPKSDSLGEIEIEPKLNVKGISLFKANFLLIQQTYLEENL
jgi:hypothetical protein